MKSDGETAALPAALSEMGIVKCPRCRVNVLPISDGRCPQCQTVLGPPADDHSDNTAQITVSTASDTASAFVATSNLQAGSRFVTVDLFCLKCRYNLRTLSYDSNCPECNTPVRDSAHRPMVLWGPVQLLRLKQATLGMICSAVAFPLLLPFTLTREFGAFPYFLLTLIAGIHVASGWIATTVPANREQFRERLIRFGLICFFLAVLGMFLHRFFDPYYSFFSSGYISMFEVSTSTLFHLLTTILCFGLVLHIHQTGKRMADLLEATGGELPSRKAALFTNICFAGALFLNIAIVLNAVRCLSLELYFSQLLGATQGIAAVVGYLLIIPGCFGLLTAAIRLVRRLNGVIEVAYAIKYGAVAADGA